MASSLTPHHILVQFMLHLYRRIEIEEGKIKSYFRKEEVSIRVDGVVLGKGDYRRRTRNASLGNKSILNVFRSLKLFFHKFKDYLPEKSL